MYCLFNVDDAMHSTRDIYPVSDFNRKPAEHIKRLQETRRPEVLTVNGKAAVVLLAPATFDTLTQQAKLSQTLDRMNLANRQFEEGDGHSVSDVFAKIRESANARVLST